MAHILRSQGFDARIIRGGLNAWKKAGMPLENVPEVSSPLAPGQSTTQADEAPTAQIIIPAPASPCANAYMPVVAGASWNYTLSGAVFDTYTHSILSVNGSNFSEQDVFASGVTRQGDWACQNGDLIALNPGGGASVSTEGLTSAGV